MSQSRALLTVEGQFHFLICLARHQGSLWKISKGLLLTLHRMMQQHSALAAGLRRGARFAPLRFQRSPRMFRTE